MKMKIVLLALFLSLLAGFIGLNILAYNHARAMTTYKDAGARTSQPENLSRGQRIRVLLTGVTVTRPQNRLHPQSLADNTQVIRIPLEKDITLEAWYANAGTNTPLVILFHGYAADKTALLPEARAFRDMGYSVMLVDFRGSGGSSQTYTTIGYREADDVKSTLALARQELAHSHFILFGQSMGAVAILRAIQHHGIKPDAVIIEAIFDTMLNTVRNRFRAMNTPSFPNAELLVLWGGLQRGFNAFKHNPVDYASTLSIPVLFMHGENDPRATLQEGQRVFDAVPGPKEWVTFPRSKHESYVGPHRERWRQAIRFFLPQTQPPPQAR
jgi:uncharacterized protein